MISVNFFFFLLKDTFLCRSCECLVENKDSFTEYFIFFNGQSESVCRGGEKQQQKKAKQAPAQTPQHSGVQLLIVSTLCVFQEAENKDVLLCLLSNYVKLTPAS